MDRTTGQDYVVIDGKRMFSDGSSESGAEGTVVDAGWLNGIQEELAAMLEENGITLDPNDSKQILKLFTTYGLSKVVTKILSVIGQGGAATLTNGGLTMNGSGNLKAEYRADYLFIGQADENVEAGIRIYLDKIVVYDGDGGSYEILVDQTGIKLPKRLTVQNKVSATEFVGPLTGDATGDNFACKLLKNRSVSGGASTTSNNLVDYCSEKGVEKTGAVMIGGTAISFSMNKAGDAGDTLTFINNGTQTITVKFGAPANPVKSLDVEFGRAVDFVFYNGSWFAKG